MSADANALPSTISSSVEEGETRWTDEQIRWPEDYDDGGTYTTKSKQKAAGDYEDDSEEEENEQEMMNDPFKDPDLPQKFPFRFQLPPSPKKGGKNEDEERSIIDIELQGYKYESDRIWESTGLTVWKASKHLCDYLIHNQAKLLCQGSSSARPRRVLELGAGLGLCGILVHLLLMAETNDNRNNQKTSSTIYVTDGDTDALAQLRQNIASNTPKNRKEKNDNNCPSSPVSHPKISCHQLIWGRETSLEFLEKHCCVSKIKQNGGQRQQPQITKFDLIIASDIIYSKVIVQPLWETIQILLRHPQDDVEKRDDAVFVMAFAKRKVPVEFGYVLEKAEEAGFQYQLVEEKTGQDIYVYEFRWAATTMAK